MKKKLCIASVFIAIALSCGAFSFSAFAQTPTEPVVLSDVTMELSQAAQTLPQPKVYGQWSYKISIYDKADTALATPIAKNIIAYSFAEVGEYILQYDFVANDLTRKLTTNLKIADSIAPKISMAEKLEKNYAAGKSARLSVKITDNSKTELEVKILVMAENKDITSKTVASDVMTKEENGIYSADIKLAVSGKYSVKVVATDKSGNSEEKILEFGVGDTDSGLPIWAIMLICVGGAAIIAGGSVLCIFIVKKRKKSVKQ